MLFCEHGTLRFQSEKFYIQIPMLSGLCSDIVKSFEQKTNPEAGVIAASPKVSMFLYCRYLLCMVLTCIKYSRIHEKVKGNFSSGEE